MSSERGDTSERAPLKPWIAEIFATFNLAFLAVDIYFAHSVNDFRNPLEWVPFYFSIAVTLPLLPGIVRRRLDSPFEWWAGLIVGAASVVVGVGGMILHLDSNFFARQTLQTLVYTAPFIAPLSYTGVGLLLILNRMRDENWSEWVVFLALCGMVGNFGLSVLDHAQNGFFYVTEYIPVVSAGLGVGFLVVALDSRDKPSFLKATLWVMALQVVVGVLGAGLHLSGALDGSGDAPLFDRLIFGAPIFAPLLFANIAALAGIGIWDMLDGGQTSNASSHSDADDANTRPTDDEEE